MAIVPEMRSRSIARDATAAAKQTVLIGLSGAAVIVVGMLITLVILGAAERSKAKYLAETYRTVGQILLIDERLTMSARMAAATGDERWIKHYEASVPVMNDAILRAKDLAPPNANKEFDATTRASNDRLVALERAALDAARTGNIRAAKRLLNSGLYAHHKRNLEIGTRDFLNSIIGAARDRTEKLEARILMAILLALLVAIATSAFLWHRLNARLSRSEAAFLDAENTIHELATSDALRAEKLSFQKVQLDTALDNMGRGLSMFDSQARLIVCNRFYREIYDLPEELAQPGTSLADIIRYHKRMETGRDCNEEIVSQRDWIKSHLAELADGRFFSHVQHLSSGRTVLVTNQPLPNGGWVDLQEDITEKLRSEAEIAHLAHHDALTGLANRVLLSRKLDQGLACVQRGEQLALFLIDLDHFKIINDTLGHPIGDELLKVVAERLRRMLRAGDTISRMGGDEFAIIQVGVEAAAIAGFAKRLIDVIGEPYDFGGQHISVGASVGIVIAPADGDDAEQLFKNADLALYEAKAQGRGTCCFYEKGLNTRMQARHRLEADLRNAVAAGELSLHYQPIVNIERNKFTGAEALMRWRHPERGMVPPSEFIPVAEESGLIISLGESAVRQACVQGARWPEDLKVAVNLSPLQFKRPGLVSVVASALAASGLEASRLELEITESVLLDDSEENLRTLYQLRDLGVRIALDDFGTGYSSLRYLQRFPFDKIKIDQSFIKTLATNKDPLVFVRAIVMLARSLGITTTAEGVETKEQLDAVRFEGCDEIQGYFISQPRSAPDIDRLFLARGKPEALSESVEAKTGSMKRA